MLTNKIAIITGGTSGIGKASVIKFLENNAKVIIVGVDNEGGIALKNELLEKFSIESVDFQCVDVSIEEDVKNFAKYIKGKYGRCDILFNNAGIHLAGRLLETIPSDFDKIMAVDCKGVYLMCYYIMPMMISSGEGTIINMSSISGIFADYSMAAYNTAKGAITNLTRSIAIDYGDKGIRCNAICPGAVETEMLFYTFKKIDYAEEVNRKAYPTHTFAKPEEIAELAVFLGSRKVDFINGVNIPVDGGITSHTGQPKY